jgi:uncharacterized protein YebE (UPF0316 family)
MDALLSPQLWLSVGFIFSIRVFELTLDTLRVLFILRGRKAIAWVVGFGQALLFTLAITIVLQNLDNFLNVIGYAAGFATGVVVGMFIEERLAIGFTHLRLISPRLGSAIADKLRDQGYAVTEIPGRGKDGTVTIISCNVMRRHVGQVTAMVNEIDSDTFVTAEDIRPVRRGFWRA